WVFGGLAPFAALGGLLLLPSLRQLRSGQARADVANRSTGRLGLAVLTGLRRLLPAGTVRFEAGVPAAIAYRGVVAGVFVGMEVLVPLTLTVQWHYSPTKAGLPLMLTALSWAAASQIQSRIRQPNRALLLGLGMVFIAAAGLGMALVAAKLVPGWLAYFSWPVAGFGAGFALT